jgi:hypothetical protein
VPLFFDQTREEMVLFSHGFCLVEKNQVFEIFRLAVIQFKRAAGFKDGCLGQVSFSLKYEFEKRRGIDPGLLGKIPVGE